MARTLYLLLWAVEGFLLYFVTILLRFCQPVSTIIIFIIVIILSIYVYLLFLSALRNLFFAVSWLIYIYVHACKRYAFCDELCHVSVVGVIAGFFIVGYLHILVLTRTSFLLIGILCRLVNSSPLEKATFGSERETLYCLWIVVHFLINRTHPFAPWSQQSTNSSFPSTTPPKPASRA